MTADIRTDAELAGQARKGDEQAFTVLVGRYLRMAYDFAFRYVGMRDEAEDIVQDAFVKVWKALGRYDPKRKFSTWLIAIVRNTALDALKKRRSPTFSEFEDAEGGNIILDTMKDTEPLADALFERKLTAEVLDQALARLPPDRRTAVLLHERDGMTFEEIAVVMKKPMNTVKSWYRRSLKALRGFLEESAPKKP